MSASVRRSRSGTGSSLKRKLEDPHPSGAPKKVASGKKEKPPISKSKKSGGKPSGGAAAPIENVDPPVEEDEDEGLTEDYNIASAVRRGMRTTNVRLETNFSDSTLLGCACDIYWPGDDVWYPGRIMLVSIDGNKCFVYYDDGMSEWVDLNTNAVTIHAELGKVGNWAVYKMWVSSTAIEMNTLFAPIKAGRVYINYLKEKKAEHAFVKQAEYSSFYVKNSIDRSMKNLKLALAEIEVKRNIIEEILAALSNFPVSRWGGQALVGRIIRAPAAEFVFRPVSDSSPGDLGVGKRRAAGKVSDHAVGSAAALTPRSQCSGLSANEINGTESDNNSVYVYGFVRAYSSALDMYYVTWGEAAGQSTEVSCTTVACLLDFVNGDNCKIRVIPHWIRLSDPLSEPSEVLLDVTVRSSLHLQTHFPPVDTFLKVPKSVGKLGTVNQVATSVAASTGGLDSDAGSDMQIVSIENDECALCRKHVVNFLDSPLSDECLGCFENTEAYERISEAVFELKECDTCHKRYHSSCMPEVANFEADKSKKVSRPTHAHAWRCWFCTACEECSASVWDTKLRRLSLDTVATKACGGSGHLANSVVEKIVCVSCAEKFADDKKEYCPICVKVYPSDDEIVKKSRAKVHNTTPAEGSTLPLPTATLHTAVFRKHYLFSDALAIDGMSGDVSADVVEDVYPRDVEPAGTDIAAISEPMQLIDDVSDGMVECNECGRWVHAKCESINNDAFEAIGNCSHPVWGGEYLCPKCRYNICNKVMLSLEERDIYGLFAEPVSDDVAPGYSEMIRNPMDLSTMRNKLLTGAYKSLNTLRQDFELVCDNAFKFNKRGDKYWKATLLFFLRGESIFSKSRVSSLSTNGENILKSVSREEVRKAISNELNKTVPIKSNGNSKDIASETKESKNQKLTYVGIFEKNGYHTPSWLKRWLETADSSSKSGSARASDSRKVESVVPAVSGHSTNKDRTSSRSGRRSDPPKFYEDSTEFDSGSKSTQVTSHSVKKETDGSTSSATLISLPNKLIPSHLDDAVSYVKANVLTSTPEIAFYECCRDRCLVCGCAEVPGVSDSRDTPTMIFCTTCGEGFHSFCIFQNESEAATIAFAREDWKCTNCSSCEECDDMTGGEGAGGYIYCDGCDRAYHLACITPKLVHVPPGNWYCRKCVHCKNCLAGAGPDHFYENACDANNPLAFSKGRLWGQSTDFCIICTLGSIPYKGAVKHRVPSAAVEQCLSLKDECVVCSLPVCRTGSSIGNSGSPSEPVIPVVSNMHLRCTICLRSQHFQCSEAECFKFFKDVVEVSESPAGIGEKQNNTAESSAWKLSLMQYYNSVRESFTCQDCNSLLESRNCCETVHSQMLNKVRKTMLISKLYKDNLAPLSRKYTLKVRRLDMLTICRVVLMQAVACSTDTCESIAVLEHLISSSFLKRKKTTVKNNIAFETVIPMWAWKRCSRFLDILYPERSGAKTDNDLSYLKGLNDLLTNVLDVEDHASANKVGYFLDSCSFEKIMQLSSLASSFTCMLRLLLLFCGQGGESDNAMMAMHDHLILYSDASRKKVIQFFNRREVEVTALKLQYGIRPGVSSLEDELITVEIKPADGQTSNFPLISSQDQRNFSASVGDSSVNISAFENPNGATIVSSRQSCDAGVDMKVESAQQVKKKKTTNNPLIVQPVAVGNFVKRVLGKPLKVEKGEKKSDVPSSNDAGLRQTAMAPTQSPQPASIVDEQNPSAGEAKGSDMKTAANDVQGSGHAGKGGNAILSMEQFVMAWLQTWTVPMIAYTRTLSESFDAGILADCPIGTKKEEYLGVKLCVKNVWIIRAILAQFSLQKGGYKYLQREMPDEQLRFLKRQLDVMETGFALELEKNKPFLDAITATLPRSNETVKPPPPAPPAPPDHSERLRAELRQDDSKHFDQLTAEMRKLNIFIEACLELFLIQPVGCKPFDFSNIFVRSKYAYKAEDRAVQQEPADCCSDAVDDMETVADSGTGCDDSSASEYFSIMSTCKAALSRVTVDENHNTGECSAETGLVVKTTRGRWETTVFALNCICGPESMNTTRSNCVDNSIAFSINKGGFVQPVVPEISGAPCVNDNTSNLSRSTENTNDIARSIASKLLQVEDAQVASIDPIVAPSERTHAVVDATCNSIPFVDVDTTLYDCHVQVAELSAREVVEDIVNGICDVVCGSVGSPLHATNDNIHDFEHKNDTLSDVDGSEMDWSLHGGVDSDVTSSTDLKLLSTKCISNMRLFEPISVVSRSRNNFGSAELPKINSRLDVQGWNADHIHLASGTLQRRNGSISDGGFEDTQCNNFNVLPWVDSENCVLCHRSSADISDFGCSSRSCVEGRLLALPGATVSSASVHVNCLLWSSGVFENKAGVLRGTASAIRRGSQMNCSYCGEKGATVGCEVLRCNHVYHLRCAVAAGCQLTELVSKNSQKAGVVSSKKSGENKSVPEKRDITQSGGSAWSGSGSCSSAAVASSVSREERRTVAFCPEHSYVFASLDWKNAIESVVPEEPNREIIIGLDEWVPVLCVATAAAPRKISKANVNVTEKSSAQHVIARMLLDQRTCVRIGALTVHSVGSIALNSPWFHESDLIIPLGFESTRLFWSYKNPGKRTLYRFDVLSSTSRIFDIDFQTAIADDSGSCGDILAGEATPADLMVPVNDDAVSPSSFPLYRVVAMDDQQHPYIALSAEECYVWMREQAKEALQNRNRNTSTIQRKSGELNLALSAPLVEPVVKRPRRSGMRSESDDICQIRDVRLKALLFFGLGLDIVRIAIEMNRDSVVAMLPSLCFPPGRYLSETVIGEINDCMKRLVESRQLPELQSFSAYNRKSLHVAVYKPRFLLPQRLSTVEVLRRLVSLRKSEPSGFSSMYTSVTESCSRSRMFSGKKYGGSTDDDVSEFAPLTAAASQLLSTSHSKSGGSSRGRSLAKRTVEEESAGILERLSSPGGYAEGVLDAPGTFNLSAERLQAKLEQDYWVMHDNNINEVEKHLAVQRSGIHGWGIYAQRDFAPNSMIVEYVGEQIRHTLADLREIQYERASGLSGSCYLFRLDKDLVVDATHVGGMARFLNHCCEPSCFAYVVTTGKKRPSDTPTILNSPGSMPMNGNNSELIIPRVEQKHIVIMAGRHIKTGEEITYDYKFPIEEGEKLTCHCGASFCRGSMN